MIEIGVARLSGEDRQWTAWLRTAAAAAASMCCEQRVAAQGERV